MRIYLLFEVLSIIICLYGLYGQKFQWNIFTIMIIAVDVTFYQLVNTYDFLSPYIPVIYLILFIYLRLQFRGKWITSIINYILMVVTCAILQMIGFLPVALLSDYLMDYRALISNILLLLIVLLLYRFGILHKISKYMNQKGVIVLCALFLMLTFIFLAIYRLNLYSRLNAFDFFILLCSIVILTIIILLLQRERNLNEQMKTEQRMNQLYGSALVELIDRVKINQHNYRNQLVAIQGMAVTATSLEELRKEQMKFYSSQNLEEQYSSLIGGENDPILAGFLYSRLCNINNMNISCTLHMAKEEDSLFLVDIIKILGVLIDNAIEEESKEEYNSKGINICIKKSEDIIITVENICRVISMSEMSDFFKKGISSKGGDRGLGLYSVNEMVKKWNGSIIPQNIQKDGQNWFSISIQFAVKKKKYLGNTKS